TRFKCDWSSDVCSSDLEGEQFQRELLDRATGVLDDNEYFSHHTNLSVARNSTSCTPPSPESVTLVPAWRGGRLVDSTTVLVDPAKPTSSGEMPRSARDSVCTGFFFAAMMPFSDGYRGSLIVSHTET